MPNDNPSREELLNGIRKAEREGAQREESAKARAAKVRADTLAECSRILEEAEKEGRAAMRQKTEAARAESAATRERLLEKTAAGDREVEASSKARMPAVAELIFREFKKEMNVKD